MKWKRLGFSYPVLDLKKVPKLYYWHLKKETDLL